MISHASRNVRIAAVVAAVAITALPFICLPPLIDWSGAVFNAWFDGLSSHGQHVAKTIGHVAPMAITPLLAVLMAVGTALRTRRAAPTGNAVS